MLQDEEDIDITWYDRIIARRLSFLCWPSSCVAPELAKQLQVCCYLYGTVSCVNQSASYRTLTNLSPPFANKGHGIGADDVLLDVGCGVGLAMLTFRHMLPCKRVHGIELSKRLFDVCYKNVQCALGKDAGKQGWLRADQPRGRN